MTRSAPCSQWFPVAPDQLLSLTDFPVTVRGDCLVAYQNEFDYLCCSLRRLGIGPADIEDIAHEVFLVLHRRWQDYDPNRPLRPWLFGIAFRVASAHRKRSRREVPQPWLELEDLAPPPDQVAVARQARELAVAALERIPIARRAVLVMHDLDDISMNEIAATLSIPVFTAYSRLRKARKEFETNIAIVRRGPKQ
jgi:RNA polymerase sigma-70 factor (ECF subfamily)